MKKSGERVKGVLGRTRTGGRQVVIDKLVYHVLWRMCRITQLEHVIDELEEENESLRRDLHEQALCDEMAGTGRRGPMSRGLLVLWMVIAVLAGAVSGLAFVSYRKHTRIPTREELAAIQSQCETDLDWAVFTDKYGHLWLYYNQTEDQ